MRARSYPMPARSSLKSASTRGVPSSGQLRMHVTMGRKPAATSRSMPSSARRKAPSPRMSSLVSRVVPSRLTRSSRVYGEAAASSASASTRRPGSTVALVRTVAGPRARVSARMPRMSRFMKGSPPVK